MSHPSVTGATQIACDVLRELRAAGEHELGDWAEADLAEAVRTILRAAGPGLRETIAKDVAEATP